MHHAISIPMIGEIVCDSTRLFDAAILTRQLLSQRGEEAFGRDPNPGHITGSTFILSPDRSQTLLLHHKKLDRWVQPGGHCDGDTDVRRVALKEASEETGLENLQLVHQEIFDIDVHEIPARADVPAHLHFDVRFVIEVDPQIPVPGNSESHALAWVPLDSLEKWTDQPSVLIARKAASWIGAPASKT